MTKKISCRITRTRLLGPSGEFENSPSEPGEPKPRNDKRFDVYLRQGRCRQFATDEFSSDSHFVDRLV